MRVRYHLNEVKVQVRSNWYISTPKVLTGLTVKSSNRDDIQAILTVTKRPFKSSAHITAKPRA
jgi:hypothetical protein